MNTVPDRSLSLAPLGTLRDKTTPLMWSLVALIFAGGLLMRVAVAIYTHAYDDVGGEAVRVAHSIAETGSYSNPFGLPTGPKAHVAPVYPYLLSLLLRVTPTEHLFKIAATMLAVVVTSLLWALLPVVAVLANLPARVGLLAGGLGALDPFLHWVELNGAWETPLSALVLMAVCGL